MLADIVEPVTMLTDYLVAGQCLYYCWRLLSSQQRQAQISRAMWALAFFFIAVAALSGGSNHGFANLLTPDQMFWSWKISIFSIGVASFFILAGTAKASLVKKSFAIFMLLVSAKLCFYLYWMWSHNEFIYVISDYAPTLLVVMAMQLYAGRRLSVASSKYIVWGVIVSFAAAGLQMAGLDLHRHFNHNDIYHVVQMFGFYLFYRGAGCMIDLAEPVKPARNMV